MKKPNFDYDKTGDTLTVNFVETGNATGIELNENILLRVNLNKKRAVGITVFNYSILAQPTELGFRSIPLNGLNEIPPEIRKTILGILQSSPVKEILSLSAYTPSVKETILITSLRKSVLERKAA